MFNFYDPRQQTENAAAELCRQDPVKLSDVSRDPRPGAYLISHDGDNPMYADIRGLDKYLYGGSSLHDFGGRTRKHWRSLVDVHDFNPQDLNPDDFWVRGLAMPREHVRAVEDLLVRTYMIRWNQPEFNGFGNNNSTRVGSRASNWDIIHPGRPFALGLKRPSEAQAKLQRQMAIKMARDRRDNPIFDLFGL